MRLHRTARGEPRVHPPDELRGERRSQALRREALGHPCGEQHVDVVVGRRTQREAATGGVPEVLAELLRGGGAQVVVRATGERDDHRRAGACTPTAQRAVTGMQRVRVRAHLQSRPHGDQRRAAGHLLQHGGEQVAVVAAPRALPPALPPALPSALLPAPPSARTTGPA